ncbi:UNVERIFIED_CONTAM: hypothetical protein PYX00_001951 [Menopon gallinae]|uniref:Uncharacterized protein n=1 Tax=Menopon gallinae TaxID=328185 RepID=A0AAW2IET6_9NEOP
MPLLAKFRSPEEEGDGFTLPEKKSTAFSSPWEAADYSMPPRYRLRDLILGEFAFNDDGESFAANQTFPQRPNMQQTS